MDELTTTRIATFTRLARELRAYAERQEARAPGRMYHVTKAPLAAAEVADRLVAAYTAGDKAAASAARAEYGAIVGFNSHNVGGIV